MPLSHFMRADLVSALIAVCLFSLVAFVPGYVVSWVANVLDFRSQTAGWRFVISVPVSIAICPILANWVDSLVGRTWVWTAFVLCWLAFAALAHYGDRRLPDGRSSERITRLQAEPRPSASGSWLGFHLPSFHMPSRTSMAFAFILILWIALVLGS